MLCPPGAWSPDAYLINAPMCTDERLVIGLKRDYTGNTLDAIVLYIEKRHFP